MKSRPSFLDVYKSLLNGKMRTDMSQKVRIFKAFAAIKNGNKGARTLGKSAENVVKSRVSAILV